jgi:DNA-binding MarR family transcriptional regulator
MAKNISREKVEDDLYLFLRTIYHYERNIAVQFDLDYQEIYLLESLRRESPQRLTEIARRLDIPMFSASRLVARLAQMELVSKDKSSGDRRSISVQLLSKGKQTIRAIDSDSYSRILNNSTDWSQTDFDSLFRMAEKLYEVLGIPRSKLE